MKKWLAQGLNQLQQVKDQALQQFQKMPVANTLLGKLPVWVSSESSAKFNQDKYDEKHYFVVPYPFSSAAISLHSMRCLPKGYSALNDLPKRRVFHFADADAEQRIKQQLTEQFQQQPSQDTPANSLINLANNIDELDSKLTNGMLLLGGLVFFVNPIVGVGIAAKALLPGIPSLLSKYGIRPLGDKLSDAQMKASVQNAHEQIKQEFSDGHTLQLINPVLAELKSNLQLQRTNYDPLLDFDLNKVDFGVADNSRFVELTCKAISHVYKPHLSSPPAQLSINTWRWLQLLAKSVDQQ